MTRPRGPNCATSSPRSAVEAWAYGALARRDPPGSGLCRDQVEVGDDQVVEGHQWLNQAKSEFGTSEKRLICMSPTWCVRGALTRALESRGERSPSPAQAHCRRGADSASGGGRTAARSGPRL